MRAFIVGILIALPTLVAAQQPRTLIDEDLEHGGFGGPMLTVTQIASEAAILVGGGGGWLIDHTFYIGGAGMGLATKVSEPHPRTDGPARRLNFGYGGLIVGYIHGSDALVHWGLHALVGAGGVGFQEDETSDPEPFFVAEPGVLVELNVAEFFRIAAGASYRYITGVNISGVTRDDLDGPAMMVQFKFGSF
jgi:hypothetical protein